MTIIVVNPSLLNEAVPVLAVHAPSLPVMRLPRMLTAAESPARLTGLVNASPSGVTRLAGADDLHAEGAPPLQPRLPAASPLVASLLDGRSGEPQSAQASVGGPDETLEPPHVEEVRGRARGAHTTGTSPRHSPKHHANGLHVRRGLAHIGYGKHHSQAERPRPMNTRKSPAKESGIGPKNQQKSVSRTHPSRVSDGRRASAAAADRADPALLSAQAETGPRSEQARVVDGPRPHCVRMNGMVQTIHDVRAQRFTRRGTPFCADRGVAAAVHGTFVHHPAVDVEGTAVQSMATWMVVRIQPEVLADDMESLVITKYVDRASMATAATTQAEALGQDVLSDALSLSALPAAVLQAHEVDSRRILPRNSFKLLQHPELGGTTRNLLAWFVHRPHQDGIAFNAGFLPVDVGIASFTVRDTLTGLEFHSDNLVDFINGLERISGNSLRPDADHLPNIRGTLRTEAAIAPLEADNLFVRLEACQADDASTTATLRSDIGFFDPQPFSEPEHGAAGWLYRNSFVIKNDWLMYRQADGSMGTLRFDGFSGQSQQLTLSVHTGDEAIFIREHGLQAGQVYTLQTVRNTLQNHGLLWLPARDDEHVQPLPGVEMFQFRVPEQSSRGQR